jgi:hypothetical protein
LRHAVIVYPWHPFFGMAVQISHNRRGKKLITIHTDIKPGYSREAPPWMLDPSFCAGMNEGPPEVNIESLNELAISQVSLREDSEASWITLFFEPEGETACRKEDVAIERNSS